jgi:hypothetical protein
VINELILTADSDEIFGDPKKEPQPVTGEPYHHLAVFNVYAVVDEPRPT